MLLWIFSTAAVAPSLPSLTFCCGVDFGSHGFRDKWQDITEWLIVLCAMTMEVQRQTCACRFCLCMKPGILSSSIFIVSFVDPDTKAGFLKQQIFKDTWNLNVYFTPDLVSRVCIYDKADLHYRIRNHAIAFNCPVQAPSFCRIQPPWLWRISGRAGLQVSVLLLGSVCLLAARQRWLSVTGGLSHVGTFPQHQVNCASGHPKLTDQFLKFFQVRFPSREIKGTKWDLQQLFLGCYSSPVVLDKICKMTS